MPSAPLYRRVLLKISGEALMGDRQYGIDPETVDRIAGEVAQVIELGAQVCLVVGGGNIFRGMAGAANGMERTTADYMGMLATVMNALALQSACEARGPCRPGCSRRSPWRRCASPISAAAPCAIWKRGGW